jgi:hypothetical protein
MSLEGTMLNGSVVLDEPATLPDGTRVEIVEKVERGKPTLLNLLALAGTAKNLPADFAAEHDHYIHGTPRRTSKAES